MTSTFAITAPATAVYLHENRLGEMPFNITNRTDRPAQAVLSVVPLDTTPAGWFSFAGKPVLDLRPHATGQVLVRVEPPLGVEAGEHLFRVDASAATAAANAERSVGPSCSVVVPPSQVKTNPWKTPRGYLATLVGASVGGALGELIILLSARAPEEPDCDGPGCIIGSVIAYAFFLIIAILLGLILLWIGSAIGTWVSLRVRRYLGSKLTALFLAVLMVPWTIGLIALLNVVDPDIPLPVVLILAPVLLTAVPGVIARGAVLLIRTRHL